MPVDLHQPGGSTTDSQRLFCGAAGRVMDSALRDSQLVGASPPPPYQPLRSPEHRVATTPSPPSALPRRRRASRRTKPSSSEFAACCPPRRARRAKPGGWPARRGGRRDGDAPRRRRRDAAVSTRSSGGSARASRPLVAGARAEKKMRVGRALRRYFTSALKELVTGERGRPKEGARPGSDQVRGRRGADPARTACPGYVLLRERMWRRACVTVSFTRALLRRP
eukprot:366363-Chlamydomonas_euryale.AAC.7